MKRVSLVTATAILIGVVALSFKASRVAHAQGSCTAGQVCDASGTITWYATDWGSNQVMVTLTGTVVNPDSSCSFPGQYETLPASTTAESSALLGAVLSGKSVTLQISGTECTGSASRPAILGVQIAPAS
jgi:hypothetical protein